MACAFGKTGMHGIPGTCYLESYTGQKFSVAWCDPAVASRRRVIPIDVGGPKGHWRADYVIDPKFSADGRFLAIVTRFNGIFVVEPHTGRHWRAVPPGEEITSSSWCGQRELGYIGHTNFRGEDRAISDRTLWRVPVESPEGRRRIFQEANVHATRPAEWGGREVESWSPDGKYVVLSASRPDSPWQVRDTADGHIFRPGRRRGPSRLRWAIWSPDGSGVLCLSQDDEPTDGNDRPFRIGEVLLVSPPDQKVRDLTKEFKASFDGCEYRLPASWMEWSSDGRHLLVTRYARLVRLDPWRVVRPGKPEVEVPQGTSISVTAWRVGTLPVPERLWSVDEDARLVMIDYTGHPVARWERELPENYDLTFSPDGRFVVIRDTWRGDRLDVHALDWTPLK